MNVNYRYASSFERCGMWEQVGDAQGIMGRMLAFHLLRWNGQGSWHIFLSVYNGKPLSMRPKENQVQFSWQNKMASRLLRWALDKEAQVQGHAGSLCCVSGKKLYSLSGPPLKGWTIMEFSRNAESYVQWTGIYSGCPYSRSKEFEVSSTWNELLSPEFTDNLPQINARNLVLQHFST